MSGRASGRILAVGRRIFLSAVGLLGLVAAGGAAVRRTVAATPDPRRQPVQPGDILVHRAGPRKGQPIVPAELPVGGPHALAWPMAPDGKVRDGNRLNQLLVVRLEPTAIDDEYRSGAADGVLCFSAICTHECCPVNMWKAENRTLYCSCHGSEFDPAQGAAVVAGPAPRRLPAVPLRIEGDRLVVAGEPSGRPGCRRR